MLNQQAAAHGAVGVRHALGESALAYAKRGWAVFPLGRGTKKPLQGSRGLTDATRDVEQIRFWWLRHPEANVGIATGAISGVVVVDIDDHHGGGDTLHALERKHGALPTTLTAKTPRGGLHYVFAHPGGRLPNTASDKGNGLGPGIDTRGDGGYIVAAPSTVYGRPYAWDDDETPIAPLPGWIAERLREPEQGDGTAKPASVWTGMLTGGIPEGKRDETLASCFGHLLAHGHWIDEAVALLHVVNRQCCRPPLPERQVTKIARSVARRDLVRRRGHGR